jgi:creatinine amidohydrolase/Fe(II)-dependent formamide hydrolase-like protein
MAWTNWRELTSTGFGKLAKDGTVVVLPTGSMEQHGPHLPVGTDSLCVEAVLEGVSEQLDDIDCLCLPTLWCTKSNEHSDFPGTVFLSRETFSRVLEDVSASVARAGFRKLVIVNGHGGNSSLLATMIRDIRQDTGLLMFLIDFARLYGDNLPGVVPSGKYDIHAGRFETSLLLARYPHLVRGRDHQGLGMDMEKGKPAASFGGFRYLRPEGIPVTTAWVTTDYTTDGVIGDPSGANAAEGQKSLGTLIELVSDMLREVAQFEYRS